MATEVGIGVIGLGIWGELHVLGYQSLPHARVVAVADARQERARQVAERHGIPKWYTAWEELVADPQVQAVSVVTPEDSHAAPTIGAATQGKHILVEKPIATTREDARSMITAAQQAGVFLMPGHVLRFALQYAALHQHVASGAVGRIVSVFARRNRARDFHRHYLRSHPALVNTVHDIDQVLWLVQQPVQRVRAWHRSVQGLANPEAVWAVLEFTGGTVAVLETMWLLPDGSGMHMDDQVEVIGEHGVAHLSMLPSQVHVWGEQGVSTLDAAYAPVISDTLYGALRHELAYFVTCVALNQPPTVVTAEDGYKAIDVAITIVESATTGRDVVLRQP